VLHEAVRRPDLEILDRVGGGESFASGAPGSRGRLLIAR